MNSGRTVFAQLQDHNGHFKKNQQQDKTPVQNGVRLQGRPLFPAKDALALWTPKPEAFNLNTKEGEFFYDFCRTLRRCDQ